MTRYSVIYADPPWTFVTRSQKNQTRVASRHYATMSLAEIMALPVADLAADDCVLFLWVTDPMLAAAWDVIAAWGFRYKTVGFYWVKTSVKTGGYPMGTGFWTRANPEQCWLATRGAPKRCSMREPKLIFAPRREHSRKPDEVPASIERLVAGPYVELFARTRRPGWDIAFSDEPERFAPGVSPSVERPQPVPGPGPLFAIAGTGDVEAD